MTCKICLKILMIVCNSAIFLGGAAILIIGGLIEVTKKHIFGVLDNNTIIPEELALLTKASYLMIAVGGVIAFMGFLGCCGACCENKCLLKIFFNIIFIVFVVEVIAAVLLLLDRPGAENFLEKISNKVAKSIKDTYGQNDIITRAWNETMTLMKCCGYNNYTDFQGTTFETQTSLYPNFCCSDEQSLPCDLKKAETAVNLLNLLLQSHHKPVHLLQPFYNLINLNC
ncbi:tetraspanin-1-like [Silurus meridionalis]|uniref:tetraspanin-1-like n=1 Tax=Silurus meridionalis TaxID=175797 RepID=UPI001EEBD9F7|nr:tetraspanin-1-like [Silurus meridionalis]